MHLRPVPPDRPAHPRRPAPHPNLMHPAIRHPPQPSLTRARHRPPARHPHRITLHLRPRATKSPHH
jgi:hypothetical protein